VQLLSLSNKKHPAEAEYLLLVDPNDKFWNTFFDIILEWAPTLKQIYQPEENNNKLDN
jgi:hypothetical protein